MLDVRKDFPYFSNDLVFLDSASTTQKPKQIIDEVSNFYKFENASNSRGNYNNSYLASEIVENTRLKVAEFINSKTEQIAFTTSTTDSINKLAYMLEPAFSKNDLILVSTFEHHSNLVPWQQLSKRIGVQIQFFNPLDENLEIPANTKLVAITAVSNVLGVKFDLEKIVKQVKNLGAKILLDACQMIAHYPLDASKFDYVVFSGHKIYSLNGVGILYSKDPKSLEPKFFGGGMVEDVNFEESTFYEFPKFMEAGTQDIASIYSLGLAIEYLNNIGFDKIQEHEKKLINCVDLPQSFQTIKTKNPNEERTLISFYHDSIHPHDIAQFLESKKIQIRAGHHCAKTLHRYFGVDASSRISIGIYNNLEDVESFNISIRECERYFSKC